MEEIIQPEHNFEYDKLNQIKKAMNNISYHVCAFFIICIILY